MPAAARRSTASSGYKPAETGPASHNSDHVALNKKLRMYILTKFQQREFDFAEQKNISFGRSTRGCFLYSTYGRITRSLGRLDYNYSLIENDCH